MRKLSKSLEAAIQGWRAVATLPRPAAPQENPGLLAQQDFPPVGRPVAPVIDADEIASSARKRNPVFKVVWRFATVKFSGDWAVSPRRTISTWGNSGIEPDKA
jgi:hypothetical protein